MYTRIKTAKEIEAMRKGGSVCARILGLLVKSVEPGVSTKELANFAASEIKKSGAKASFHGYNGFPDVICISVNEEVVHGIPAKNKVIKKGDIVSFDLGITHGGMIVDSAKSVLVGSNDPKLKKLVSVTEESLIAGIDHLKHNCRIGDISFAVQAVLKKAGYGIVRDLVGHGVGHSIHEEPNIPNYGQPNSGPLLKEGMTIAIEPMATLGGHEVYIDVDGWTVKTRDNSMSAHFEHTVLIKKDGYEILTQLDG